MLRCAKRHVIARVETIEGKVYYGSNARHNDYATECPRLPGEGYDKCIYECWQKSHAEVEALEKAGAEAAGGTLTVYGHYHVCEDCAKMAVNYGIAKIVIEVAP